MSLEKICNNCECGLCCFLYLRELGYLMNNPSKEFVKENNTKLVRVGDTYFTKVNKDFQLCFSEDYKIGACSFLEYEINEDKVTKIGCIIHESKYRPKVCESHKPSSNETYIQIVKMNKEVNFEIKKEKFELNDKIRKVIQETPTNVENFQTCKAIYENLINLEKRLIKKIKNLN